MNNSLAETSWDEQAIIRKCLNGDRNAFSLLIERYQNLVCAITFSIAGRVQESQELAHESFVAAWKELPRLQDASKFKPWLCAITRNISNNWLRKNLREGSLKVADADLDRVPITHTPTAELISREEERLVWDALEHIPPNYREPLILFYRQGDSVSEVAKSLDLSEENVRQRLARGRALLKAEVANRVEGCLRRTRPGKALALGVLAAMPAFAPTVTAASIAAGAKSGAETAAAAGIGLGGAVLGPAIGMGGAYLGFKAAMNAAKSEPEKQFLKKIAWNLVGLLIAFAIAIIALVYFARPLLNFSPWLFAGAIAFIIIGYLVTLMTWILKVNTRQRLIQMEQGTFVPMPPPSTIYMSKGQVFGSLVGVIFGGFSWLVLRAWQTSEWTLFLLLLGIAGLIYFGGACLILKNPRHGNRIMFAIVGVVLAVTLVIVNIRSDLFWMNFQFEHSYLIHWGMNGFILLLYGAISTGIWLNLRKEARLREEWNRRNIS